jgi:hypothetical protein
LVGYFQTFDRPLLTDKNGKDTRTLNKDNVIGLKKPESIIVLRSVPGVRPTIRKNHQTIRNRQNILFCSLKLPVVPLC